MLRFKKSAAVNSAKGCYLQGVPKTNSLFQIITDNAKMQSQNNKLLCHCLATVLTKNEDSMLSKTSFPRLKKMGVAMPVVDANYVQIQRTTVQKNLRCHRFQNVRLTKNS